MELIYILYSAIIIVSYLMFFFLYWLISTRDEFANIDIGQPNLLNNRVFLQP